jgi:predicted metalloprotease
MKSINVNMTSVEVKSGTRAIRATWTPKMAVDLESYHNIDIEQELSHLLKEEIRKNRVSNRKKSINKIFQN